MYKNPYIILNIPRNATHKEIKDAYKKIVLENHPDKHHNKSAEIKEYHINIFREATEAYNKIINDEKIYDIDEDIKNWKDIWGDMNNSDFFKNLAKIFIDNNLINKKNKNIYKFANQSIKHKITLSVSYKEVYFNMKKKLRLILKHIDEPLFFDIQCGTSFPNTSKLYIDDDDIEHDIIIDLVLIEEDNFNHIINKDNKIDIVTNISLTLVDYLEGYNDKFLNFNDELIDINIPPFNKEYYELSGLGINNGSLIFKIKYKDINIDKWHNLSINDKIDMIRILRNLY
jgi:hypothetical protein|uniref:J domain-containing protein n=1 Tax=viral metagenome TaxID=1070528 RepID=A0A6C0JND3_9ZZZZ